MELDLIASIVLTVVAGIVVATLSIGLGDNAPARVRIAAVLVAWLGLVTLLGATRALHYPEGIGAPGLGMAIMIPIIVLSYSMLRVPSLRRQLETMPMSVLVGLNGLRIIGVFFLILFALGRLPSPFALEAGWGDILAGMIAIIIAWRLHVQAGSARTSTYIWNTLGMLDLFGALALGVTSSPGPLQLIVTHPDSTIMTLLPWLLIPAFLVPIYIVIHFAVYLRLRRTEPNLEVVIGT